MIIKKVTIENYMCYYGVNHFEFANGLNIILGENGEGKTKFFEALEWLFKGGDRNLDLIASAKKLDEIAVGESFVVKVTIQVEQYEEHRYLSRSFNITKDSELDCTTSKPYFEGIEENKKGERSQVDAERLLGQVFPNEIRKYSLFKGESELNVFENDDALINLINLFSDAKYYEKYAEKGKSLRLAAEEAVTAAAKRNTSNQKKYERIERELNEKRRNRTNFLKLIESEESQLIKLNGELQKAEKFVDNAEALEIVNNRIKKIEDDISTQLGSIQERYTTYLFDDGWILSGFEPVFEKFKEKVNALNTERRFLQRQHDLEEGRKQGARENVISFLTTHYPWILTYLTNK
jgi:DNA sulfur modification protein DndD